MHGMALLVLWSSRNRAAQNARKRMITCHLAVLCDLYELRQTVVILIFHFLLPNVAQTLVADVDVRNSMFMHIGQSDLGSLFAFVSFVGAVS